MKKMKQLLFGLMTAGLVVACTSENGIMPDEEIILPVEDNRDWQKMDYELDVQQGEGALTRTIGDLDENKLPPAKYPSKCGIYLHTYDSGAEDYGSSVITLREPESNDYDNDGKVNYYYFVDDTSTETHPNGMVSFKKNPENVHEEEISVKIAAYAEGEMPEEDIDLFFFASQREINPVRLPEVKDNWYPNLYEKNVFDECGDKLFSSEGYFFWWKDEARTKLGLFYIVRNDNQPSEIKEITEIKNWVTTSLSVHMKRMTACVSIRLMLLKEYGEDGTIYNVDDAMNVDDFEDAVKRTNNALQNYLATRKAQEDYNDKYPEGDVIEAMKTFDVRNILVRKKVFDNFPYVYNWGDGFSTRRGSTYLCNLDYPSWIDAGVSYQHGSMLLKGLTSTCDNEPFIPADSKNFPKVRLDLFMGIGKRDPSVGQQGGTYNKLIRYTISFGAEGNVEEPGNGYAVKPNTHTYIYVGITLENIIELYYSLFIGNLSGKEPATRSDNLDDIPCITLPSNQMIVTSEPYISEHTH